MALYDLIRDLPLEIEELALRVHDRVTQLRRPDVFPHEERRRRVRVEFLARGRQVVLVEQAHRRTKSILAQMLVLRGSRDFLSVEEYQRWVREVIEREHNAVLGKKLDEERRHLPLLPAIALPAYTTLTVKVRRWSTTRVLNHA